MLTYPIRLAPDDNGAFLVTCPDLPEVTSFGMGQTDALIHGRAAVSEAVAARLAAFEAIPHPSQGKPCVDIDLQLTMKVELFWALQDSGFTRADLVRMLGLHRPQIDRLFAPRHATRLDQYEAAFRALGRKAQIVVQAA